MIRRDSSEFSQTQKIADRVTATYQHILSNGSAAEFVGRFTCEVRDGSGVTTSRTLALNGVLYISIVMHCYGMRFLKPNYKLD